MNEPVTPAASANTPAGPPTILRERGAFSKNLTRPQKTNKHNMAFRRQSTAPCALVRGLDIWAFCTTPEE